MLKPESKTTHTTKTYWAIAKSGVFYSLGWTRNGAWSDFIGFGDVDANKAVAKKKGFKCIKVKVRSAA